MKTLLTVGCVLAIVGSGRLASAQGTTESVLGFAGAHRMNLRTGQMSNINMGSGFAVRDNTPTVLYSNLTGSAAAQAGFSSAGTASIFGDELGLTAPITPPTTAGPLSEFACTLYNASTSNTVTMTSGTLNIQFLRASDSSLLGSLSINIAPFVGSGLSPGFFTIVDVTGIEMSSDIEFDTNDILVKQSLTGANGGRYGVVIYNPVQVGSSPSYMYIEAPPATPAGFYNLNGGILANPGYFMYVPTPSSAALLGLGGLVAARRRRQ